MWATTLLRRWARLERGLSRGAKRVTRFLAGVASAAATPEELERLTVAIHGECFRMGPDRGLHPFEEALFARGLPEPPAKILVTAAGSGREVAALQDRGYPVDAFEPAAAMYATLARACRGRSWRLDYARFAAGEGPEGPYDAVLLGWGSFSHVLDDGARVALLRRCAAVTRGPILATLAMAPRGGRDPALRAGAKLAASLRRGPRGVSAEQLAFWSHAGFLRQSTDDDLQRLAASVGRRAELMELSYPAVVFLPQSASSTASASGDRSQTDR